MYEITPENPEVKKTPGERLLAYLQGAVQRAISADMHVTDTTEEGEVNNGTFTSQVVLVHGQEMLRNTVRVVLEPPRGRKRSNFAEIFAPIDSSIKVFAGEPFEFPDHVFIREYRGNIPGPLELVSNKGVSLAEVLSFDPEDVFKVKLESDLQQRAVVLHERLSQYNIVASAE